MSFQNHFNMGTKICRIFNGQFSWHMEVDGRMINFEGRFNADYFKDLYTRLGYVVEFDAEYYLRGES